ncbi:MAG: GTP pyrophosphokinase [Fusobacteriaceae bacterium]|nr:GTP pyrophosphokinase [Fusobacteriaceae bacterium]MBP9509807.1 GTP pyrophosphokinase [Fusobacteriaceae bacterium]
MLLNKENFFKEFNISEEYFDSTGLNWDELNKIYSNYTKLIPTLEKEAEHVFSKLIDLEKVHSVRRRVKKPKHLIEKIIRKGKKYSQLDISVANYKEIVTDLIGIRVLHLFKDEWRDIHKEIIKLWELMETPQINIRRGDYNIDTLKDSVDDLGCEIVVRDHGYRSIHYLISIPVTRKEKVYIEIQVRTVFEEAWSEIDHVIRYPYDNDNPFLVEYLGIFNRIVGSADEMGTFIKKMKTTILEKEHIPEIKDLDNKYR